MNADLEFRYNSSLISLTDAIEAARNATRSGSIYKLPVDDYFVFIGGKERNGSRPHVSWQNDSRA